MPTGTETDERRRVARRLTRRRLLALAGTGVTMSMAGCDRSGDDTPTETAEPTGTATVTSTETATESPAETPTGMETATPTPVSGGSNVHYEDGFADTAWFDDSVTVHRVQEATVGAVREAFAARGPRLVVFEASGVIDLQGGNLAIRNDKCWVAGQTAPSPGITFINGMVQVQGDDCVIQHVRVMRGETGGAAEGTDPLNNADGTQNVVFDHCTSY